MKLPAPGTKTTPDLGDDRPTTSPSDPVRAISRSVIPSADPIGASKTAAVPPEAARVGTIIAKRYEILGFLGKGGMGLVYKARDMELSEDVAIKLLQPEYTRELSEIERLKREIVTARKITHPNVIRLHDFGLDDSDEGFISMEVLPGGSLADLLDRGPLAIPRALDIAIGISEGLAAAHDKGIIHRDMKPENVLFDEEGIPKLVDFGLARTSTSANTVWAITGTPRYMSPEQTDGEKATPKSDVYSTGVLLFLLFTGRLPFLADNILALATQHAEEPPPRPRSLRQSIPPRIEQIVLRCLEKDPAKRYPSARALASELRQFRDAGGARDAVDDTARVSAANERTQMFSDSTAKGRAISGARPLAAEPAEGSTAKGSAIPEAAHSERTEAGAPASRAKARPPSGRFDDDGPTAQGSGAMPQDETADHPSARKRNLAPPPPGDRTMIGGPPPEPANDRTLVGPAPASSAPARRPSGRFDPLETQRAGPPPGPAWGMRVGFGLLALLVLVASYLAATRL